MPAQTRSQQIAAELRTDILRNRYRPGERLPSERDLAQRFSTNRGTIREALKQLQQLGIIHIQPGGVRIVPREDATLEVLDHLLNLDPYPNPKLIDDYLQVFKMICAMSAEQSITRANDEQLASILMAIQKMKKNPTDHELMREGWTVLFDTFLKINDNLVVRLVANGLGGQFTGQKTGLAGLKPTVDEKAMTKILNGMIRAVKQKDPKLMSEYVAQYFEWARKAVGKALRQVPITQSQVVGI